MSLREFGRSVDKTGEAVRKAIATGKIPADCVGQKALNGGRLVPVIINAAKAAKCWGQNVDPNQVRDKRVMSESRAAAHARARGEEPKPRSVPADEPDIDVPDLPEGAVPPLAVSKSITAAYEAKTAKIVFEEKAGKLVNAEQIRLKYFAMIKTAQTKLRGVATKAKSQIPTLTVRDIEILEDMIDEAMKELAGGR